jgi:hypothetical protein
VKLHQPIQTVLIKKKIVVPSYLQRASVNNVELYAEIEADSERIDSNNKFCYYSEFVLKRFLALVLKTPTMQGDLMSIYC